MGKDVATAITVANDTPQDLQQVLVASNRHHLHPGMHCSWCQFRNECMAWLPGMDWHAEKAE